MVNLVTLLILVFAVAAPVVIGATYFLKAPASSSLWLRMATSAYAPTIGFLFVVVGAFWPDSHHYNERGVQLLWQLQAVPLLLLVGSLAAYPGPKRIHWVLVPASVALWVWIFGMSWISVHGM